MGYQLKLAIEPRRRRARVHRRKGLREDSQRGDLARQYILESAQGAQGAQSLIVLIFLSPLRALRAPSP